MGNFVLGSTKMVFEDASLTISEFCEKEKICRATFYNLLKQGKGPRLMRVGSRSRISPEARAEWRREREAEFAAGIGAQEIGQTTPLGGPSHIRG
jgi:predicted DNA-binding transcriptional regulator AlpA